MFVVAVQLPGTLPRRALVSSLNSFSWTSLVPPSRSLRAQEYLLRAKFGLPSVEADDDVPEKHPPIRVKFEIPYFTVSGIQVRSMGSPVCSDLVVARSWTGSASSSGFTSCVLKVLGAQWFP